MSDTLDPDRLPEHARALELFRQQHFDTDAARILARSELERRQRLDAHERPQAPAHPNTEGSRES